MGIVSLFLISNIFFLMLTPQEIGRLLKSGLQTTFMKSYDAIETYYQDIVTQVPSTKASEEYGWLGDTDELREWNGERLPKALKEYGFTIRNKSTNHLSVWTRMQSMTTNTVKS